jgi:hypothetical protein
MKKLIVLTTLMAVLLTVSCSHHHHTGKSMPPGQAKKITGSKSAKPYAPGQQKKH